ncbi:MAG: hypothetical protein LBT38_03535 [Deltaproteobacteria bacterium]|nr:hypothetical protein [Deltaproteobacteria bacterium]
MTIFQFKVRKLIDEIISTIKEEDSRDPIEHILVIARTSNGSRRAYLAGLENHETVLEFIGYLEEAKTKLILSSLVDDDS